MKLLHCHIENFGALCGFDRDFTGGLNLICERNGFGKSTLAVFIKAMFYGLPVTSKRDITENERKKYRPWGGGAYGGALEFETEGKRYRIERFFGTREKDDRFTLYDLDTGKPSDVFTNMPGLALFGVDADGFERSVYISQRMPHVSSDNSTIKGRLGDLLDATDDLGNYDKAVELLRKEARRYVTTGGRGRILDLQKKLSEKEAEVEACKVAQANAEALYRQAEELTEEKRRITERLSSIAEKEAEIKKADTRRLRREEQALLYRRLLEAKEKSKEEAAGAARFFNGQVPDDRELKEAEELLAEYGKFKAHVESCLLPAEKTARLAELRTNYASLPFSEETVRQIEDLEARIAHAEKEATEKTPRPDPILETEKVRFSGLNRAVAEEVQIARDLCEADEKACPEKVPARAFVLLALGLLAVLSLLLPHTVAPVLPWILAGLGVVLILGGLLILFGTYRTNRKKAAFFAAHEKKLEELLRVYGCNGGLSEALLLLSDMERYLTAEQEKNKQLAAYREAEDRLNKAKAEKAALLSPFGEGEPDCLAEKVKADFAEYTRLLSEEKNVLSRHATWEAALRKIAVSLETFLGRYGLSEEEKGAAYRTVVRQKLLYDEAERQAEKAEKELADFLAESGYEPNALPESTREEQDLRAEKESLFAAAQKVETEIALLKKEAEEEKDRAQTGTLLAEKEALEAEKGEAEATFHALEKAEKFLEEAKEGLSTRYLGGMEESFRTYMQALSPEGTVFRFDTDLTLRAEKGGERREIGALSAGERDLALFCGRLSLVDAIFRKEKPVLILDDPFVNLDDEHYAAARRLLAALAEKTQILYFVCRKEQTNPA